MPRGRVTWPRSTERVVDTRIRRSAPTSRAATRKVISFLPNGLPHIITRQSTRIAIIDAG
jgi:hypothetical protein